MAEQLDAEAIARLSLHDPKHFKIQHAQTFHRVALLQEWLIPAGSNVLELGCGQGDCTTVLATAVGDQGSVTAVDPADLDYGSPFTLGQAQSHISSGHLGPRITWNQQSPIHYLSSLPPTATTKAFDAAVLAHSLWYFSSPALILATFRALKQHSTRLLLAEWSLIASSPAAQPHVLAALTQAALEAHKPSSDGNIRTVVGPRQLTALAVEAGWTLDRETRVVPEVGLLDGKWEVGAALSSEFEGKVEEFVEDERATAVVFALRDACAASLEVVESGPKGVRSMDVWVASFV